MSRLLLVNGTLVNEGREFESDILIDGDRIERIDSDLSVTAVDEVIDVRGCHVLPGLIDDQVHLREPGLTHKATIPSESRAAICGGVTSFMEMPNTSPPTTDRVALAEKYVRAKGRSYANYAFYLGATNNNLEEIRRATSADACGIKVFMGASTGNMLVDNHEVLEKIFADAQLLIATHCEDTPLIRANEETFRERYGEDVPISAHPEIRSTEACYLSSSLAVEIARRYGTRLHVLHLTTAREMELFESGPIDSKQITAEACVHHLWFDESDYAALGTRIKCNPAIKTASDRMSLIHAVQQDRIDVIATDHAPHTLDEKNRPYFQAPAGLPLVQHSLQMLLQQHFDGLFQLAQIVTKTAHNPARLFGVVERGFLREGYYADLVVVDLKQTSEVTPDSLKYLCGWSPLEGQKLNSRVIATVVNGEVVFRNGQVMEEPQGRPLEFKPK